MGQDWAIDERDAEHHFHYWNYLSKNRCRCHCSLPPNYHFRSVTAVDRRPGHFRRTNHRNPNRNGIPIRNLWAKENVHRCEYLLHGRRWLFQRLTFFGIRRVLACSGASSTRSPSSASCSAGLTRCWWMRYTSPACITALRWGRSRCWRCTHLWVGTSFHQVLGFLHQMILKLARLTIHGLCLWGSPPFSLTPSRHVVCLLCEFLQESNVRFCLFPKCDFRQFCLINFFPCWT